MPKPKKGVLRIAEQPLLRDAVASYNATAEQCGHPLNAPFSRIHPTPWLIEHPYQSCTRRNVKGLLRREKLRQLESTRRRTSVSGLARKTVPSDMSASMPTNLLSAAADEITQSNLSNTIGNPHDQTRRSSSSYESSFNPNPHSSEFVENWPLPYPTWDDCQHEDWDEKSDTFSDDGIMEDVFGEISTEGVLRVLENVEPYPKAIHLQEHANFPPAFLSEIVTTYGKNLFSLNLRSCNVTDLVLRSMRNNCMVLRRLDLSHCELIGKFQMECLLSSTAVNDLVYLHLANLPDGVVSDSALLSLRPKNLLDLNLSHNSAITDQSLLSLSKEQRSLRVLNLSHLPNISTDGLVPLLQANEDMRELIIPFNNQVNEEGQALITDDKLSLGFKRLRRLELFDACGVPIADKTLSTIAENARNLQVLKLAGCTDVQNNSITKVLFHAKNMKELILNNCTSLSSADGSLPTAIIKAISLESLHISFIPEFQEDHITQIKDARPDLTIHRFAEKYHDGKFEFVYPNPKPGKAKKGKKKGGKKKK